MTNISIFAHTSLSITLPLLPPLYCCPTVWIMCWHWRLPPAVIAMSQCGMVPQVATTRSHSSCRTDSPAVRRLWATAPCLRSNLWWAVFTYTSAYMQGEEMAINSQWSFEVAMGECVPACEWYVMPQLEIYSWNFGCLEIQHLVSLQSDEGFEQ